MNFDSFDFSSFLLYLEDLFNLFISSYQSAGPLAWLFAAFIESFLPMLPLTLITLINIHSAQQGLLNILDPWLASFVGWIIGFLISWLGTSIGASIVFMFHRYLVGRFYGWVKFKLTKKIYEPPHIQSHDLEVGVIPLFAVSIIPYSPSSVINFTYAFTKIQTKSFIYTTLIAKFIMMLIVSIFANVLIQAFTSFSWLTMAVMVVTVVIWFMTKKYESQIVNYVRAMINRFGPKKFRSKEED